MDEAILLRDDGLELCARVAQRREENGPPWAILAIWWFWVRAPWTYHKDHKDHKASITGSAPGWKMSSSSRSSQVFAGHPKTRGRIGTSPRPPKTPHVSSLEGPEPALFEAQGLAKLNLIHV